MSLKLTTTVDSRGFNKALRELAAVTDRTLDEVLKQQARLAVKDAISLTPPFHKFGTSTSRKHLKAGENAIERDLNNIFSQASESFIDASIAANGGSRRFIKRQFTNKKGEVYLQDWADSSRHTHKCVTELMKYVKKKASLQQSATHQNFPTRQI